MVIGITLVVIELVAAPFSGAGVNPARSLSAAIVAGHWNGYDWIYYVGYTLPSSLPSHPSSSSLFILYFLAF